MKQHDDLYVAAFARPGLMRPSRPQREGAGLRG
jgi:hypothetical protein